MYNTISPDLIEAALGFIPANCPRDDWAKIIAAIKSEFASDSEPKKYAQKSTG